MDRWHYDILQDKALAPGEHNLTFQLGSSAVIGKAQLCSFEIIEYGSENESVQSQQMVPLPFDCCFSNYS